MRSTSNHSQQGLLREEVLNLTQENAQSTGILRTDLRNLHGSIMFIAEGVFMEKYQKREYKNNTEKKEKPKQAIALSYDPDEAAPRVIASGKGALAERIIERAKEADVPVHTDSKLADTLSRLEIGDMIPPELYEVVAEILVFVDAMDKIKEKMDRKK